MTERRRPTLLLSIFIAASIALLRWVPEQLLIGSVWDAQAGIAHMVSLIASSVLFVVTLVASQLLVSGLYAKQHTTTIIGALTLVFCLIFTGAKVVRFYNDHRAIADATDPNTPTTRLNDLSDYRTTYFGYELDNRLAANPNSPTSLLRDLHGRNNLGTLMCLSRNPNTPQDILAQLSTTSGEWIQKGLADNPSWSPNQNDAAEQ